MQTSRYVIIGAGLAGAEAAKAIRSADPDGSITLIGKEPHPPYNRPPLSKAFLRGEKKLHETFVQPDDKYQKSNIELLLETTVTDIDPKAHTVTLQSGESIRYEKLLLASGGRPATLDLPGMDLPGVYTLRTLEHSQAIGDAASQAAKVVLIGGGFIGVEVAASLRQLGAAPTVLEKTSRVLGEISNEDASEYILNVCRDNGIRFQVNADVAEVEGQERPQAVRTADGKRYECDFVVVAVGIKPNIELAKEAGLALEAKGIRVDASMRTSDPDIYAAGDIANYPDPWFDHRRRVEHWGQAEYTGRIAGRNMAGKEETYDLVTYIWSDIFDLHLEFSGWSKAADSTRLRGKPGDKNGFIVLYLKNHVLKAYLAVNAPKEDYQPLEALIKKHTNLREHLPALTDPATSVKSTVESIT